MNVGVLEGLVDGDVGIAVDFHEDEHTSLFIKSEDSTFDDNVGDESATNKRTNFNSRV